MNVQNYSNEKRTFPSQIKKIRGRSRITLGQLSHQMIDSKYRYNEISQSTYYRYLETLKMFGYASDIPVHSITEEYIKNFFIDRLDYSQSTLNKLYALLNSVLSLAVRQRIIKVNPIANLKPPRSKQHSPKTRALTVNEEKALLTALSAESTAYNTQIIISLFTGMRMGEINALKASDINLISRTVSVNKTVSRNKKGGAVISNSAKTEAGNRTIIVDDNILKLLQSRLTHPDAYLFTGNQGQLITTCQVNEAFKRILVRYNVIDPSVGGKVTLHSLRHTYATRMIEAGVPPKVLAHMLGHTDIKITLNRYCDAFEQFQNESLIKANRYLSEIGIASNGIV